MINIYTIAVNRPEFPRYQFETFKRFLTDAHRLTTINDGHDEGLGAIPDGHRQIADMARTLNILSHTVTPVSPSTTGADQ